MHALHHARSSAAKWGGVPDEYMHFHLWFDESKDHLPDVRHRALRHHSLGIQQLVEKFGEVYTNTAGKSVPVRYIGEQHVTEDLGRVPTFADWMRGMKLERWMSEPGRYDVSGLKSRTRKI
jgi:hypothetical protein